MSLQDPSRTFLSVLVVLFFNFAYRATECGLAPGSKAGVDLVARYGLVALY